MTSRGLSIIRTETGVEPVALEQLKAHLVIDFDDHDTLLNDVILPAAREEVEKYTGLSLVDSDMKVRWEVLTTQPLPYGPVKVIVSVKDSDNEAITDYTVEGLLGGKEVSIKADRDSPTIIEYTTGFETVPYGLKLAIMKCATDHFELKTGITLENQNGAQSLPNDWKSVAKRFSVKSWLA